MKKKKLADKNIHKMHSILFKSILKSAERILSRLKEWLAQVAYVLVGFTEYNERFGMDAEIKVNSNK